MPKPSKINNSSPLKSNEANNLSTQIVNTAETSQTGAEAKNAVGQPRRSVSPIRARSVSPQRSPRRLAWNRRNEESDSEDEVFANESALRKFYVALTSVEHQTLLQGVIETF